MTVTSGFFNSDPTTEDRLYDANDFNRIMRGEFSDGRMAGYGDTVSQFVVSSTSNPYEISVTPGAYLFSGMWLVSTETEMITIDQTLGFYLALVIRSSVANRNLAFTVINMGDIDTATDSVLAYFSKDSDGAIVVTQQLTNISMPMVDYQNARLVESGTMSRWIYEKWLHPDGRKIWKGECTELIPSLAVNTANGALYSSGIMSFPDIPAGIRNVEYGTPKVRRTGGYAWGVLGGGTFRVFAAGSLAGVSTYITYYATGTWT